MHFRNDINGLRALAVTAVILFHFEITPFFGGFIGVDVFFVISGYLMTGIIVSRINNNTFDLIDFYVARGKRILPALVFLCLAIIIYGWFFIIAVDYKALGKHIIGSISFISNFMFWSEANYFDVASNKKWLLHTWSLSVEWQFYLIFPIIIMGFKKIISMQKVKYVLFLLTIISFVLSIYFSKASPSAAFYLLPTRAWEMLCGSLVYLTPFQLRRHQKIFLQLLGVFLIILSIFIFDPTFLWPSYWALIPVTGAVLVIFSDLTDSVVFSNQLTQLVGKWSYSLYLWHWPVVVALAYTDQLGNYFWVTSGIVFTIVLAYLSFTYIENPKFLFKKMHSRKKLIIGLFTMSISCIFLGMAIYMTNGVASKFRALNINDKAMFLQKYREMHQSLGPFYRLECDFYDNPTGKSKQIINPECTDVQQGKKTIFLWGDSHAQALSWGLNVTLRHDYNIAQVATSACTVVGGVSGMDNNCELANKFALKEIARIKPDFVVIAQHAGHEHTDWDAIAENLYNLGVKKMILVGPIPQWGPPSTLPEAITLRHWGENSLVIKDEAFQISARNTDKLLNQRYPRSNVSNKVHYISLFDHLCDQENECLVWVSNESNELDLLVVDYGHLSPAGSIYISKEILTKEIH